MQSESVEPIVVRPSGVWNSRSPLNDYVLLVRQIHRTHAATALSGQFLHDKLNSENDTKQSIVGFVRKNAADVQRREKFARMYYRSFGVERDQIADDQSIATLANDRDLIERGALQHATIQLNGAIESYIQCWFLNLCLAKLESGRGLDTVEAKLVEDFNPAYSKRAPNLGQLVDRYGYLQDLLGKLPPFRRHPKTRQEVKTAESPARSARREISYWQNYRNLLVHSNGHCSPEFARKFGDYHSYKQSLSRRIPPLEALRPLPIDENMFSTQAACFYRVAYLLRDELLSSSKCTGEGPDYFRRGHRLSPGLRGDGGEDAASPPLLLDGDHQLSLLWTRDAAFRSETATIRRWKCYRETSKA